MSTGSLSRPGVEVEQIITPATPTIVAPTLVPCMVGPCFALAEPFNTDGSLNSETEVATPGQIKSASVLSDPIAVASEVFALSVDGGNVQVMSMPAVATGSNLPLSQIPIAIAKKIVGVTAKLESGKLVLTSKTTGDNSSILVWSKAALVAASVPGVSAGTVMATSDLGLTSYEDLVISGQGLYRGRTYVIPYSQMPTLSYHPSGDQLVFKKADTELYRTFSGKSYILSKTAAINWDSWLTNTTKINNNAVVHSAPHTARKSALYALDTVGTKTNKVADLGSDAYVKIPLSSDLLIGLATQWPDAGDSFYLEAEAKGTQDYATDRSLPVGSKAGTAGNALNIKFVQSTIGATPTVAYAANLVTITYEDSLCAYAALKAAIATNTDLPTYFHKFNLVYPADKGASLIDTGTAVLHNKVWYLSGGQDPVNFSSNPTAAVDDGVIIFGSVRTDQASADPCSLLSGKTLTISTNGKAPVDFVIPATSTALISAISAASGLDGLTASEVPFYSEYDDSATGDVIKLVLTAAGDLKGHACTIELSGSAGVVEGLFSGYLSKTSEAMAGGSGGGTVALAAAAGPGGSPSYNLVASNELEKALQPDKTSVLFGGVTLAAHVVSNTPNPGSTGTHTLILQHSGYDPPAGSLGDPFNLAVLYNATIATHVTNINNALTALSPSPAAFLKAYVVKLDDSAGTEHIVIVDEDGTPGNTMQLLSTSSGLTATTTSYKNAWEGTLTMFDVVLTTTVGTVTVTDVSTDGDLPMRAAPSVSFPAPSGWSILNKASGSKSFVNYATGAVAVNFDANFVSASSWTQSISYTRGAASFSTRNIKQYEGRVWSGRSTKVATGDKLYDNGVVKGGVVKLENLSPSGAPASPWGDGAVIVLDNEAFDKGTNIASWYLDAQNLKETGGRTIPEIVFNDTTQEATIRHGLNTGPNGISMSGSSNINVEFKALRLDVSPQASNPGIVTFKDSAEVLAQIGPISPDNPLAYALYVGFLHSPVSELSAMGVSEVTVNEPDGTVAAYQEALDDLGKYEVYAIAPLTHSRAVHQLLNTHVTAFSAPEQKKERIGLVNPLLPSEKVPVLVSSSTETNASDEGGSKWHFDFGSSVNFVGSLDGKTDANGNAITASVGASFSPSQGLFLERTGDAFKYLVTKLVAASIVEVDLGTVFDEDQGPGTGGNDDDYYYTSADLLADFNVAGETCSLFIRQATLNKNTTAGKNSIMSVMGEEAGGVTGYQNSRLVLTGPDKAGALVDGVDFVLEGYYLSAAVAAMCGSFSPSAPFTNIPMVGFTRAIGSSDFFSDNQLGIAAANGVYWIIQDTPQGAVFSRQQLTTDMTSLKTQELSIRRAIDFASKQLRIGVKRLIGRNNITPGLLTQIGLIIQSILKGLEGTSFARAELNTIEVSDTELDKILVDVSLTPYYPANKIRIRVIV